jgi:hypothetical protein
MPPTLLALADEVIDGPMCAILSIGSTGGIGQ